MTGVNRCTWTRAGHQQRLVTQMNQQPQNQRPDNAGWVTGAWDEGGSAFATIRRPPGPQALSAHEGPLGMARSRALRRKGGVLVPKLRGS